MNKIVNLINSKMKVVIQCFAFVVAVYAANTSCILIFHQEEMPDSVRKLNKYNKGKCGIVHEDNCK